MEYFNNPTGGGDASIELGDFREDEDKQYVNVKDVALYETLPEETSITLKREDREHVYSGLVEPDLEYENIGQLERDTEKTHGTQTSKGADTEYSSLEWRHDTRDTQRTDVESEVYSGIPTEYETLQSQNRMSTYSNLQYVRKQRFACLRRRWKLLLLLTIIVLVSIIGVVTAVVLVTSAEEPVESPAGITSSPETTTNFLFTTVESTAGITSSPETTTSDDLEGTGSGSGDSASTDKNVENASLTPFEDYEHQIEKPYQIL